jgi:hypothetical protein
MVDNFPFNSGTPWRGNIGERLRGTWLDNDEEEDDTTEFSAAKREFFFFFNFKKI